VIIDLTDLMGLEIRNYDSDCPILHVWNTAANNENIILDGVYMATIQ
jgi:hypothetical protein